MLRSASRLGQLSLRGHSNSCLGKATVGIPMLWAWLCIRTTCCAGPSGAQPLGWGGVGENCPRSPSIPACLFTDLSGPVNGESLSQKTEGTEEQERDKSRGPGAGELEAPSEEAHNK